MRGLFVIVVSKKLQARLHYREDNSLHLSIYPDVFETVIRDSSYDSRRILPSSVEDVLRIRVFKPSIKMRGSFFTSIFGIIVIVVNVIILKKLFNPRTESIAAYLLEKVLLIVDTVALLIYVPFVKDAFLDFHDKYFCGLCFCAFLLKTVLASGITVKILVDAKINLRSVSVLVRRAFYIFFILLLVDTWVPLAGIITDWFYVEMMIEIYYYCRVPILHVMLVAMVILLIG